MFFERGGPARPPFLCAAGISRLAGSLFLCTPVTSQPRYGSLFWATRIAVSMVAFLVPTAISLPSTPFFSPKIKPAQMGRPFIV